MKKTMTALTVCLLVFILAACTADTAGKPARPDVPAETYADGLPDLPDSVPEGTDFGGAEILFLTREEPDGFWDTLDLWDTEAPNGTVLNDALYKRNRVAENALGCLLTEFSLSAPDMSEALIRTTASGDDLYQAVLTTLHFAPALMQQGQFIDLGGVSALNLTAPRWDVRLNDRVSVLNRQYYAAGDLNLMSRYAAAVLFFNTKTAASSGVPDLYQLVGDGKWTMEAFSAAALSVNEDLDGDGVMNARDKWGIVSESDILPYYMAGCGLFLSEKNTAGLLSVAEPDERGGAVFEAVTKVFRRGNFFDSRDGSYNPDGGENTRRNAYTILGENRALFFAGELRAASFIREIKVEYGLLPFPKLDENQPFHITPVLAWGASVTAIPYTAADTARIGTVIETLSYLTARGVTEAFAETVCRSGPRDIKSAGILALMFETQDFDPVLSFDYGGMKSSLRTAAAEGSGGFASVFNECRDAAQEQFDKIGEAMSFSG